MSEKKIENHYIQLFKRIESLSPELREIYFQNWDETGRPKQLNSEVNAMISILNKNASAGYPGFKLDVSQLFEKEDFSEQQLATYYNIFVAEAAYIKNRLLEDNKNTSKIKP